MNSRISRENSPLDLLPIGRRSDAFRFLFTAGFALLMLALQAAGAAPEYVLARAITALAGSEKVELAAGQTVTVLNITNGTAMIRVTLPNGSLTIVQTPSANLVIKSAAPTPSPATTGPATTQLTPSSTSSTPPGSVKAAAQTGGAKPGRTLAEVDKMIDEAGKQKPDWWDSTQLHVPPTLDLKWKSPPGNPQNDMGAYFWNVVFPNSGKWKEGIKLLQKSLAVCSGDPVAREKAEGCLANIYATMLGDYARGAFWAKKSGGREIILIVCYLKLGCPPAAIEMLRKMGSDQTRNGQAIKLWAELGDLKTALEWAENMAPSDPTVAYLAAGDACRRFGKISEALDYYGKVLAVTKQVQRDDPVNKKRAAASIEAIKLFDRLDLTKIPDGTYKDESVGYVGPVEVSVVVKNHRIESVNVANHHEKQYYSSLVDIPPQIVLKQSVRGIDTTTGATVTSEAIINASAKALSGAMK